MSITIKSKSELAIMREAGRITCGAIWYAGERLKAGMTTLDVDKLIGEYFARHDSKSCFKGLYGFPGNACISVNEEIIHGIPKASRRLKEGDIVSIDTGAAYKGFNGDSCWTFPVGKISDEAKALLEVTEASLYEGIAQAQVGARIGDISHAVEEYCASRGYGIVRNYCGHGIGREVHESPEVPNWGKAGHGPRLVAGMTICIEPMINVKGDDVKVMKDNWTVVTKSGSLSAHFEHMIAITPDGPVILTQP